VRRTLTTTLYSEHFPVEHRASNAYDPTLQTTAVRLQTPSYHPPPNPANAEVPSSTAAKGFLGRREAHKAFAKPNYPLPELPVSATAQAAVTVTGTG
jgi:hypothetical protein